MHSPRITSCGVGAKGAKDKESRREWVLQSHVYAPSTPAAYVSLTMPSPFIDVASWPIPTRGNQALPHPDDQKQAGSPREP